MAASCQLPGRGSRDTLGGVAAGEVITVHSEKELITRAGHLFTGVRREFICAAEDMNTWSQPGGGPSVPAELGHAIAGGLVVRKLYTPAALADDAQRPHLFALAGAGARVRICATGLPHETIIIDQRVMILAGERAGEDREFTVTTSPGLISGIRALFEAAWDGAADLGAYLEREVPEVGSDGRMILQTLATGLTDEAAARRLGISLRTYRRRVAGLMRLLEADSRFQAGVHAAERGLTR
jgi:hypothetical protein